MALDDVLHRFDRVLQALAAIDQAERRDDQALADAERGFCRIGIAERHVGNAVMDHSQTIGIDAVDVFEQSAAGFRERHDFARGARRARASRATSFRRVGQHGVQRHDDRFFDGANQVDEPFAAFAAEQAVFVLDVEQRRTDAG